MIKLSNIAAAWAALRGTTDSLQEDTQRRIHDFLDFVDPEHETARRILRHLHSSILCNDYGATTFCLRALFEGMTNLFLNEEMGESKIQEWFPDKIVNDSPATSILKNWLEQKNMNSPDCIATINGSMFLSIELKQDELEIHTNKAENSYLRIKGHDIIIPCSWINKEEGKIRQQLSFFKAYANKEPSDLRIDSEKWKNENGRVYLKNPTRWREPATSRTISGKDYAEIWMHSKDVKRNPLPVKVPKVSSHDERILGIFEQLNIENGKKLRAFSLLDKLYPARNGYAHNFKSLLSNDIKSQQEKCQLMALEFFEVFEPLFMAMKTHQDERKLRRNRDS